MRGVYRSPFLKHTTYICPERFLLRSDRGVLYIIKDIKKTNTKSSGFLSPLTPLLFSLSFDRAVSGE